MSKFILIGAFVLFVVCPYLVLIAMAVNSHRRSLAEEREQERRIAYNPGFTRSFNIDTDHLQDVLDIECADFSRPGARV